MFVLYKPLGQCYATKTATIGWHTTTLLEAAEKFESKEEAEAVKEKYYKQEGDWTVNEFVKVQN